MAKTAQNNVITVGDKGRVTLSEDIRQRLGIAEGDVMVAEITAAGTLELVPVALIPRDQVWFTHPEMQARVTEAHADIAADRVSTVRSADEMEAYLTRLEKEGRDD